MKHKKPITVLVLMALLVLPLQSRDLDLEEYMGLVEKNSRDLELAGFDRQLAANRKDQASAAVRPMISGQIGYSRNLLEITQPYPVGASPVPDPDYGFYPLITRDLAVNKDNDFSAGVGLQQTVFDMKVFKALTASARYIDLTGSVYEATRQGVLTGAKKLYFQTVLLEKVYEVKKAAEENAHELWLDTKMKFENELASELNVLQAEVNWQMKIPETTQARRNRDLALANLKHLAGIDPEEELVLTDELLMISSLPKELSYGDVLGSRPDYQALLYREELSEINISAKKSEFFPSLTASLGYGWKKSSDSFDLEEGINALQAGVTVTVPIFYGGVRFAKLDEARIEAEKARMEILKKNEEIAVELSNLNLLLEESMARIDSAETTLNTAEKAYAIMNVSSRNGLATQLDLKDALLSLEGARLAYYKSVYDYLDAYFSWQQAVGKGDELPRF